VIAGHLNLERRDSRDDAKILPGEAGISGVGGHDAFARPRADDAGDVATDATDAEQDDADWR
jgi:hypothetical protein